jgi:hypothetical protein
MSDQLKKQITGIATWLAVGALGIIGTFASIIFDDMRDAVRELHKDVKEMSGVVIRLEERQIATEKEVDRLNDKSGK